MSSLALDDLVGSNELLSTFDVDDIAKGYADKYRSLGWPIYLIGVEFVRDARNVAAFDVEPALDGGIE